MNPLFRMPGVAMVLVFACVACDKVKPPSPELPKPPGSTRQAPPPGAERTAFAPTAQNKLGELRVLSRGKWHSCT